MSQDLHFGCTQCGRCCRNLKIPLTVAESVQWLEAGGDVQVICEASPWPVARPADDLPAAHRHRRSFEALSGAMPSRVVVILAANIVGACRNLRDDNTCGIYHHRPLVCRIYPAEINPFVALAPGAKACPPEAWTGQHPLLLRNGVIVDDTLRRDIELSRATDAGDTQIKRRLCGLLGMRDAAVADEGFMIHSPGSALLQSALAAARTGDIDPPDQWRFISNQSGTLAQLSAMGAVALRDSSGEAGGPLYAGFKPESFTQ